MSESPPEHHHHVNPTAIGLRSVAVFEAVKGLLVLIVGFGLLSFIHEDLESIGERTIHFFHLDPAHRYPQIFLQALSHVTDKNLVWLAFGAVVYASVRFAEAYGLWHEMIWAEWFAIVSCGLYLPIEIYELYRHPSWIKVGIIFINLLILVFLARTRLAEHHKKL